MSVPEKIEAHEARIKQLQDDRWYQLTQQRRKFVEIEKKDAQNKPYAFEVCASIDDGYLSLLSCILDIAGNKTVDL